MSRHEKELRRFEADKSRYEEELRRFTEDRHGPEEDAEPGCRTKFTPLAPGQWRRRR